MLTYICLFIDHHFVRMENATLASGLSYYGSRHHFVKCFAFTCNCEVNLDHSAVAVE